MLSPAGNLAQVRGKSFAAALGAFGISVEPGAGPEELAKARKKALVK
jgi:hypothetical protein